MSRRCKPGKRARIIGGWNAGKVVIVVRHYFGEVVAGVTWPDAFLPWVVTSLSVPLRARCLVTLRELTPSMAIVVDDCHLDPLDDDGEDLQEAESVELPKSALCKGGV